MVKVIQFGEGNFLRTFCDLYLDTLNKEKAGSFEVNIIKPIPFGSLEKFDKQNNKYHIVLRGFAENKNIEDVYSVDVVKRAIDLFSKSEDYFALALDPELQILISNTTEAGITFNENDTFEGFPNVTYPAKLTVWLFKRFKAGLKGIYLLPVELIENNADELQKCVNRYIDLWNLGEDFKTWNNTQCFYCNTLVDRIVSGYPRDEETKSHLTDLIGCEDQLVSIGEPFGLWVIQDKGEIKNILKDGRHNIDVIFTPDISYYKKRKVRVLNGSHTNLVPISLWKGMDTVYDVMNNKELSEFVEDTLASDIIPFVSDNQNATREFANSVKERFMNPFLNHKLISIALNSISKWKARCLPSFVDYYAKNGTVAPYLTKGFAFLAKLYSSIKKEGDLFIAHLPTRNVEMKDDLANVEYFLSGKTIKDFIRDVSLWGVDLTSFKGFEELFGKYFEEI